jgi:hypothetical protein
LRASYEPLFGETGTGDNDPENSPDKNGSPDKDVFSKQRGQGSRGKVEDSRVEVQSIDKEEILFYVPFPFGLLPLAYRLFLVCFYFAPCTLSLKPWPFPLSPIACFYSTVTLLARLRG